MGFRCVRLGVVQEVLSVISVRLAFSAGFAAVAESRWRQRLWGPPQGQAVRQLRSCARVTLLGSGRAAGSPGKGWGRRGDGAARLLPLFSGLSPLLLMLAGLCEAPRDGTEPRWGAAPAPHQPLSTSSPSPSTGPSGLQDQPLVFEAVKPLDTCKAMANGLCRPEQM